MQPRIESITIGKLKWDVVLVDKLDDAEGETEATKMQIRIAKSVPESRISMILLHEILHAACDFAGLDSHEDEEDFVNRLTPILQMIFSDNPQLLSLFQEPKI